MIYYKNSSELYHHGILGQKWGVRRYQNLDGTLTPAGKKRFERVQKRSEQAYRDTEAALKIYRDKSEESEMNYEYFKNRAKRLEKRSSKYEFKATQANSPKKQIKYERRAQKTSERSERNKLEAETQRLLYEESSKKLKDIESGKLLAGRDFIIQRDLNIMVTDTFGKYTDTSVSKTFIEKKTK